MARLTRFLALALVVALVLFLHTASDARAIDSAQLIASDSGTALTPSSSSTAGYPLLFSSHPEYAGSTGKLFDETISAIRFREVLYHVNSTGSAVYLGFAIKNTGAHAANLYINRRGDALGTTADPALIGRNAQYHWYDLPASDPVANCHGCDIYIATIPAGGYWYSTNPVTGGGAPAAAGYAFLTATLANGDLFDGMYDFALVDTSTWGATTARVVSYVSASSAPATPESLSVASGSSGSNTYCPYSELDYSVAVDFNHVNGASFYFDLYNPDALKSNENGCTVVDGAATAYGNYGLRYVVSLSFANSDTYPVTWAVVAPVDDDTHVPQYFAGIVSQDSTHTTEMSSVLIHNDTTIGGVNFDLGRDIAAGYGSTNTVDTMVTAGDYAPLRLYVYAESL